jgi:hypothetical protein
MKLLDRPPEATLRHVEDAQGTLYYAPGVNVEPFADVLFDLRLNARCLEPAALVDVKSPQLYLLDGAALGKPALLREVADLRGDLSEVILLANTQASQTPAWIFALLSEDAGAAALAVAVRNALRQIALNERSRRAQLDLDRRAAQMADLHHIGVALSSVKDSDALHLG